MWTILFRKGTEKAKCKKFKHTKIENIFVEKKVIWKWKNRENTVFKARHLRKQTNSHLILCRVSQKITRMSFWLIFSIIIITINKKTIINLYLCSLFPLFHFSTNIFSIFVFLQFSFSERHYYKNCITTGENTPRKVKTIDWIVKQKKINSSHFTDLPSTKGENKEAFFMGGDHGASRCRGIFLGETRGGVWWFEGGLVIL